MSKKNKKENPDFCKRNKKKAKRKWVWFTITLERFIKAVLVKMDHLFGRYKRALWFGSLIFV